MSIKVAILILLLASISHGASDPECEVKYKGSVPAFVSPFRENGFEKFHEQILEIILPISELFEDREAAFRTLKYNLWTTIHKGEIIKAEIRTKSEIIQLDELLPRIRRAAAQKGLSADKLYPESVLEKAVGFYHVTRP